MTEYSMIEHPNFFVGALRFSSVFERGFHSTICGYPESAVFENRGESRSLGTRNGNIDQGFEVLLIAWVW